MTEQNAEHGRILAHFTPEAWICDYAVEVDAEGDQEWDATQAFNALPPEYRLSLLREMQERKNWDDSAVDRWDALKGDSNAPEWVRTWHGPFTIRVHSPGGDE